MNLSGNDKNKITGKKYQPVMSITGLNDQGLRCLKVVRSDSKKSLHTFLPITQIQIALVKNH